MHLKSRIGETEVYIIIVEHMLLFSLCFCFVTVLSFKGSFTHNRFKRNIRVF